MLNSFPIMKTISSIIASLLLVSMFTSCIPVALGLAGGYIARDKGYTVANPFKSSSEENTEQEEYPDANTEYPPSGDAYQNY